MAFSLTGKEYREVKLSEKWAVYSVLLRGPASSVEIAGAKELNNVPTFTVPAIQRHNELLRVIREVSDLGLIHRPVPNDAHLPYQGWESKPQGHWRYYIKRRITKDEMLKLLFPKKKKMAKVKKVKVKSWLG